MTAAETRPAPAGDEDHYLRLEDASARAYNRFVYRDSDVSARIRRHLFRHGVAEFSPPHGRALVEDGALVGILACLGGDRLQRTRLQGAMHLRRSGILDDEQGLVDRLKAAHAATLSPDDGDFYLSRIAVAEEHRGRGLGAHLLERFEAAADERGAERLVLDVDADAEDAVSFYRNAGYREIGRGTAEEEGRLLTYVHMAKVPS